MALYALFVPKQAVGASLIYFDLWNPGAAGKTIYVRSIAPVVSGAVAVVGVLGVDLLLQRTTAIGTGGTAATAEGSSITAMTFSALDSSQAMAASWLSARLTPSGGATAGAVLGWTSVFTEETGVAYAKPQPLLPDGGAIIRAGTGISIVQGAVASVGNIGFNVLIEVQN
jgi:hypothetical protein